MMASYKKKLGDKKFQENELKINFWCGLVAGSISAAVTNPLECITVNKQVNANFSTLNFIKKEGLWNFCMKGIGPRVAYNGCQSIIFFTLVLEIGKLFNVELGDD